MIFLSESLNQSVKLLLVHAVREQIVAERLGIVNVRQLCFVADACIIHQARVEPKSLSLFWRKDKNNH